MTDKINKLIKGLEIDLLVIAKIALVMVVAVILEKAIRSLLKGAYKRAAKRGGGDITQYRFAKNATRFIVGVAALIAMIYSVPSLKAMAVTLFAGAGILVAILGLAAQKAFANIVSGLFIVTFKPFRVGDMIQVGTGSPGIVEDITLRHTMIQTFDNRRVVIPNSVISEDTIVNSTIQDRATCEFVEMSISYDSNVDLAINIMQEEAGAHKEQRDRRSKQELADGEPEIPVRLVRFEDSSVVLRANVWADDPILARMMHYDLNKSIKKRFDNEGIEIPFPYRTIVYKKDLAPNTKSTPHEAE